MSYSTSAPIGTMDADILVTLNEDHRPTDDYVRELRERLPREFPGVLFYFTPADIVTQILNFGLPAPIDIQVASQDSEASREFATNLLSATQDRPGHRRSAHPSAFRSAQDSHQCRPHQGGRERIHAARCRQQHADFAERQLSDDARILARSAQRRQLQRGHADAAVRACLAERSAKYSDFTSARHRELRKPEILGDVATMSRGAGMARGFALQHPARGRYFRLRAGSRSGRAWARDIDEDRRRESQESAARHDGYWCADRSKPCRVSFTGLLGGLALAIVLVYALIVVNFQSLAGSVHHHYRAARGAGGNRAVPFRDAHHHQRSGVDGIHHVRRRGDVEQYSGGQLSRRSGCRRARRRSRRRSMRDSCASARC